MKYYGKILGVNSGDMDKDGIVDYADGFDAETSLPKDDRIDATNATFTPVVIELPQPLDLNKMRLRIEYSASDPGGVRRNPDGSYAIPAGNMRLWTKNAPAKRDKRPVTDNQDNLTRW